jgi:spermidine/putrescine transport system ATP-binding protein
MPDSSATAPPAAVRLQNVVKTYGGVKAVAGVSLDIAHGEFVAFIGPSGCGKTTTLRIIAGLVEPTSGTVFVRGTSMHGVKPWERTTPLVWQNFALFPFLTVAQNVSFGLEMRRMAKEERDKKVKHWLNVVGIEDLAQRSISQLSGGQRQRVALARALATDPQILLLDEPLGSLDAHLRIRMQSELASLQRELGITFIYVTHNQSEALAMANKIVVMQDGRIQQIGSPQNVYREPANRFVAEFVGTNNILSGTIRASMDRQLRIATAVGDFTAEHPGNRQLSVGQPVEFVVSADRLAAGEALVGADNKVTGRITGEEFYGSMVTLFLQLDDGSDFRLQKQQYEIERLRVRLGDRLEVGWAQRHAFVLPA